MNRLLRLASLLVASTMTAGTAVAESDTKRVQSDVRTLIEALYRADAPTVLRFTHPEVVRQLGGTGAALAATQRALEQISLVGGELESLDFPKQPEFMKGDGREFAIVRTHIVLTSGGRRVESHGFQLGVKDPRAASWTYVEGSEVDQLKAQMLFPGFPVDYEFPKVTRKLL